MRHRLSTHRALRLVALLLLANAAFLWLSGCQAAQSPAARPTGDVMTLPQPSPDDAPATVAPLPTTAARLYTWGHVPMGGGGYVTGIVTHPTEPDLVYIRTDVGGAFRWDAAGERWIPLMEALTAAESNLFGVESIAIDPSNPDVVYVAAGKYPKATLIQWGGWRNGDPDPSDVLKSADRGQTWQRTGLKADMNGNGEQRWCGERLAVDPRDPQRVYFASRSQGLFRSVRAAEPGSWQQVASFPDKGHSGIGLTFALFDPQSEAAGGPETIYVGAWDKGIYRSTDGGETWEVLKGSPTKPCRAVISSEGALIVGHKTGIAQFQDGRWTSISPTPGEYSAVSVDRHDPRRLIAAKYETGFNNPIYLSADGGKSWQPMSSYERKPNVPWWPEGFWSAATASLLFDPTHRGRVWYTDWYGVWRTDDVFAAAPAWQTYETGHEELCVFVLRTLPTGAPLLSGVADVDGFRHADITRFPPHNFSRGNFDLQDTVSLDFADLDANLVVRVGARRDAGGQGDGFFSLDNGDTWQRFPSAPVAGAANGRVAVSASGNAIVWAPDGGLAYVTRDRGATWTAGQQSPSGLSNGTWDWNQPLASDRVDPDRFYIYQRGAFYRSDDGGLSWSVVNRMLPAGNTVTVKAAPGMAGEVWAHLGKAGLFRSTDGGTTFEQVQAIKKPVVFGFGRGPEGSRAPAVYVMGEVDGQSGIFRSDDLGATWARIDDPAWAVGNDPVTMEGDRQVFGRVYIGTVGSSIYVGQIR